MDNHTADVLRVLHLAALNQGACAGVDHWIQPNNTSLLTSINPATATALADVQLCSKDDYETVINAAEQQFLSWRSVPAPVRGECIREIAEVLRAQKTALGTLIALEMGKLKAEGEGEVQEMIDIADFAVGQSRMLYGHTMHSERRQHRMYEQWHPLGVVGIVTAFNFPVAVWAWNAFIAAIAGNTVVWKPSSKTPLSALAVQHICNEVMKQKAYQSVFTLFLPVDKTVTETFIADPRIALVSFTGSTKTGRHVHTQVANRLGRSLLELGGNNAIIVDETADLDLAVRAIVFGAIGTSGQRCTTTRRLIIHQQIYDRLVARLIQAYASIRIGNPLDETVLMGPLIDAEAVEAYVAAIARIKNEGGKILLGGSVLPGPGYFVEPTLVEITTDCAIIQEETFAPILYLMQYHTFKEAIEKQNAVKQGLSSALFTNSLQHTEYFLSAIGSDCGIANINIGTSGAEIGGAFGGEKETGGGREAGSDAWKNYMRRQTTTINWSHELPLAQGIRFESTIKESK